MRQYGCVMVPVQVKQWPDLLVHIDPEDVYDPDGEHGYSLYPHVTVIYGMHQVENPINLMLYLDSICKSFDLQFGEVGVFDNKDFDVLKVSVESPEIRRYHKLIKSRFECTLEYEKYEPHLTIAYLNKGTSWKYTGMGFSLPVTKAHLMRFSNADGNETLIKLRNG